MQKDFHYYTVFYLAGCAGFSREDAGIIAYASQYVDDATESEPITPFENQHFDTVRAAHYNLEAFGWDVQKKIYIPFHFLPADIRWTSPQTFSYVVRPATGQIYELATRLVDSALKEQDHYFRLIRLGIALHSAADTFSHFGFSGRHHDENDVGRIRHYTENGWETQFFKSFVGDIFLPRIGHVEAYDFPDLPYLKWRYTDFLDKEKTRTNIVYCLKGCDLIYRFLKQAVKPDVEASGLKREHPEAYASISELFEKEGGLEARCRRWQRFTNAPVYDRTYWRSLAIEGDVAWDEMSRSHFKHHLRGLSGKTDFDTSHWAYFHRAALKHRSLVLGWIN